MSTPSATATAQEHTQKPIAVIGPQRPVIGPQKPVIGPQKPTAVIGPQKPTVIGPQRPSSSLIGPQKPQQQQQTNGHSSFTTAQTNGEAKKKAPSSLYTNGSSGKSNGSKSLVAYGDSDSSSDSEASDKEEEKKEESAKATKPMFQGNFVPRAVMQKAKAAVQPPQASSASGKWSVTDAEAHNPSEHSNNSTGSTSNWKVTAAPKQQQQSTPPTSPPPKVAAGASLLLSKQPPKGLKRGSSIEEYEEDLDRGRTKKVKQRHTGDFAASSSQNSRPNLFQQKQNQAWMGFQSSKSLFVGIYSRELLQYWQSCV